MKYNEKHNKNVTTRDIERWEFYQDFDLNIEECFSIFDEAWGDWTRLEPMEQDLYQKTKMLNNIGKVDIVTAIHEYQKKNIILWLCKHGVKYNKIVFSTKKEELDYTVFIDDSPNNAKNFLENNKLCLLYNQPWNRHVKNTMYTTRIYNLYHAIDVLRMSENE